MKFNDADNLIARGPDHINACVNAQRKLCEQKEYPHFAPSNGVCYSCCKQIYERITLNRASTDLITGCPHCSRSYCD